MAQPRDKAVYGGYFNHYARIAESRWERRTFVRHWWKIYANDPRWAPPAWLPFSRLLTRLASPHLARLQPEFVTMEALPGRRRQPGDSGLAPNLAFMEEPVAAAVLLTDPRRRDATGYLALLHLVNDEETWERLQGVLLERLWMRGGQRLVGPTGLSPHAMSGVLLDHFHRTPPWLTPYNPPYLPEIVATSWEPLQSSRLYHATVPDATAPPTDMTSVHLIRFEPRRLSQDLLPLMAEAAHLSSHFPPADAMEAEHLLGEFASSQTVGWLAQAADRPIGFILLGPDLGGPLRRAMGGRNPLWRLWLTLRTRRPVSAGRVFLAAVDPAWRRQGVGRLLWQQALATAQAQGWRSLTVGPVPDDTAGAGFLAACGAAPLQSYAIYGGEP